jgi:hypothetical protein
MSAHSRDSLVESRDEPPPRPRPLSGKRFRRDGMPALVSARTLSTRLIALGAVVVAQIVLLLIALVPASFWTSRGMPSGPIPTDMTPIVAGLFYALPSLTGLLSRRWQVAVILATAPAWLDLGIFAIAAAPRIGPYYLALEPHAVSTVGTLELFAVLGALGWLVRPLVIRAIDWFRQMVIS